MTINWSIKEYDSVCSTQDTLKKSIETTPDLPEGSVVYSLSQSNGRGRHGRFWQEGKGNLYLSFLIRPDCDVAMVGQISLLTGLAIAKTIDKFIRPNAITTLKWPNDILINDKKCCGILIDASPIKDNKVEYLIIGIGINIKSAPLETATFIQQYSEPQIEADTFTTELLHCFSNYYRLLQEDGFDCLRHDWLEKTFEVGRKISVKIDSRKIQGSFDTIDIYGNLVLMCDDSGQKRKITSGEVFLL